MKDDKSHHKAWLIAGVAAVAIGGIAAIWQTSRKKKYPEYQQFIEDERKDIRELKKLIRYYKRLLKSVAPEDDHYQNAQQILTVLREELRSILISQKKYPDPAVRMICIEVTDRLDTLEELIGKQQ